MNKGFTLVEILVAVIILSLGILAVSEMTVLGMRTTTVVDQRMYARVAMARVYEDLFNLPTNDGFISDPDPGSADLGDTNTPDFSQTITDSVAQWSYDARWNVDDNNPEIGMKTIRIHIIWGLKNPKMISTDLIRWMN